MSSFETHVVHPDDETRNETETGCWRLEIEDHRTESDDNSKPMIELRIVNRPDDTWLPESRAGGPRFSPRSPNRSPETI